MRINFIVIPLDAVIEYSAEKSFYTLCDYAKWGADFFRVARIKNVFICHC